MELISQEFPTLVIELSGPWRVRPHPQRHKGEVEKPWIVNFKNADWFLNTTHAGSSGLTPAEALLEGLVWLRLNKDKL